MYFLSIYFPLFPPYHCVMVSQNHASSKKTKKKSKYHVQFPHFQPTNASFLIVPIYIMMSNKYTPCSTTNNSKMQMNNEKQTRGVCFIILFSIELLLVLLSFFCVGKMEFVVVCGPRQYTDCIGQNEEEMEKKDENAVDAMGSTHHHRQTTSTHVNCGKWKRY